MLATTGRNWTFRQFINFYEALKLNGKKTQLYQLAMMYLSTTNVILLPKWRPKAYSVSKVVFSLKFCTFEKRVMSHPNEFGHLGVSRNANVKYLCLCQKTKGNLHRFKRGLNANEIPIPYDKHQKVSAWVKRHQNKQFCQIWTSMKRSNKPAKSQVLIKLTLNLGNECNNKALLILSSQHLTNT